jgi:hypothetical protein
MNQVSLDALEMKKFLMHMINNNRYLQDNGLTPTSVEIIGPSGLGKTSISLQLAKELGIDHVKLNLAQIEELGDLIGFPVRQFEMHKQEVLNNAGTQMQKVKQPDGTIKFVKVNAGGTVENKNVWVDENATDDYSKKGYTFTSKKRMGYCPPEWIADKKEGGILILDDWNRADLRFIQAVMELVDRQEYISWKLPKDWHIVLTANPDDGEYLVQSIDVAQRTRFVSTALKWQHERWAEWAEGNNIDSRCINFVLMHPEIISDRVNPRSLTTFFNSISSINSFENELPLIQMIGEGSIGPESATLFSMFINNKLDKLISPAEILKNDSDDFVKAGLTDAFNSDDGDYKASVASILCTRLINYTVHYSKSNPITPEILHRLGFLIKDADLFTDDLKYILVKRILNGNKQKFQKLLIDTEIQDLATK